MDDLIKHPESRSVAANRHDELMHHLHTLEMELAHVRHEIADLKEEADAFCQWMKSDTEKSQWYYDNRMELVALVEGAKWVKTLRRAIAWLIGVGAGVVMAGQQLEIWWREHMR